LIKFGFFSILAEVKAAFKAPDAPKTVLEALQQRLEKYKSTYDEAKTSGDLSKARRMQRIVKQYQDAIKDYQAKRPVDFEELPTPPGFGPIPSGRPTAAAVPTSNNPTLPSQTAAPARPSISHSLPSGRESRQEQQHRFLTERQHQFKLAALKAKKEGATETARLYLRQANGLKPMIEASANGLPVDLTSVPKAPPGMGSEADAEYDVVQYEDAGAQPPVTSTKSRTEVYSQLEKDLVEQVGMCVRNTQHFKKSGDIPMAEKFEKFNQQSRKDLDSLRNAFNHSLPTPRFHYETRTFSVVK
jgi:coiled-coil and C2 domain-containing protein 1